MFSSLTYRQKRAQNIESLSNTLWEQCIDAQPEGNYTINQEVFNDEHFWNNYSKLVKKSQKRHPQHPVTVARYSQSYDHNPLYTFSEFGRLYAIINGAIFSFCFLFICSAMINKNLLMQQELYAILLPLCISTGIFFARPFKTCAVTSNLLIIKYPWMMINKSFTLHQIREVTIDDNPNGYWFLKIRTNKKLHKYSVNINYCKLRKLLDFLGENHITTCDKISLPV